jgi:hypothetical protein
VTTAEAGKSANRAEKGARSRDSSRAGAGIGFPPLYVVALIFLLIVTLTRGAGTARFMYNKF